MPVIDQSYIQCPDHRPKPSKVDANAVAGEIPVIDLSHKNEDLITKVGKACEEWGVFQVINHGVPIELERKIQSCVKKFFDLSRDEKMKVVRDELNPVGYYDNEHTGNVRDWKEMYECFIKDSVDFYVSPDVQDLEVRTLTNPVPKYPPEFR